MIGILIKNIGFKYKSLALVFIILFSLSFYQGLYCQLPELSFRYYSKADGLISSVVNDLVQDSSGFIWIGTNNGLDRFDGYTFTHFIADNADSTSLMSNHAQKLFIDKTGILWIGTNLGLAIYNNELNEFIRISTPDMDNGLENNNIKDIEEDSEGNIFVFSDNTVYLYSKEQNQFSKFYTIENSNGNRIFFDHSDNLWIGSNKEGLIRIDHKDSSVKIFKATGEQGSINSNSIFDIAEWKGKIWLATMGGGINVFDPIKERFKQVQVASPDELYSVYLYVDNRYNLWSIDFTGLKVYNENTKRFSGYYPNKNDPNSIKNSVKGIFHDNQGNYWTYFEPGGIGISSIPTGFSHISVNPNQNWHINDPKILSIHEDNEGNLWMGNASNGIDIFYWKKGKIVSYRHDRENPYSIGRGATQCIERDKNNNMWVSNYHTGLQLLEKNTEKFLSFAHNPDDSTSIAANDIRSIFECNNGDLLLALHGKGIDRFDVNTKKAKHYTKGSHGLSNDWTYDAIEDNSGNIWVASAWGISFLPKGADKFKIYYSIQDDSKTLSNSHALCLLEDSKGNIWAGTANGLNRYNKEEDNFIRYNIGFESNYICSILEDSKNNIWVSTHEGISKLDYGSMTIENFDVYEGVRSGDPYERSAYTNNKSLYFGGSNGIDIINTDKLASNKIPPKVLINSFKIFNKEVTTKNNPDILNKNITSTKQIKLKYRQNVISIGYVAINHINPEKNNYAYKLEGFDQEWNFVENKREAIYTNLDPKKYIFKVKASNNDKVWSRAEAIIEIIILPPWYQTIMFRFAAVLLIIGLVFLVTLLRTRQLRKTQILLQQKVKEKTAELTEKNKLLVAQSKDVKEANNLLIERQHQLEEQSEEIKEQSRNLELANKELYKLNTTKDKLFSIIAHDLTSPFNTILGFSDLLVQTYDEMSDKEKLKLTKIINQSSIRVFSLLHNLLLWARSQTQRISYEPENIGLKSIVDDTLDLLKAIYMHKEITINVNCPENIWLFADMEMTKTIIRNILSNAIKFTPKHGSINLDLKTEQEKARITISDSGMGMSQEVIDVILGTDPISPGEGTEGEKGTGLGLTICKEFLTMSNGELEITSTEGKGSNFSFTLPLAKDK